ncbi:MAG: hypothetical protein KQJ78_10545 [Deltaproteobacteria bacterium]|nr:hypothetical protein [Deltaproteobacteria bacterium]
MKLRVVTCVLVLAAFASLGCNQSELKSLREENAQLKEQVKKLQAEQGILAKELDEIKNGPIRRLAQAKKYAEDKDWTKAIATLNALLEKFPGAVESQEASKLLKQAEAAKKNAEEEKADQLAKVEKERQERQARALKSVEKKVDEVEGITWYFPKYSPRYHLDRGACLYVYLGQKHRATWKRLKIRYDGKSWVFFDEVLVKVDDYLFRVPFDKFKDKKSDMGGGGVSETIDVAVNPGSESMLEEIVNAKRVIVRFSGKYEADFTLTQKQKSAVGDMLEACKVISR